MVPIADKIIELAPRFRSDTGPPQAQTFQAGQVIFEQGSRGELIYVVERGEVDIIRVRDDRSEEWLATVRPGEYFGELGPLLGFPRSATARARTEAMLTAYGQRDFKEKILAKQQQQQPERTSIIGQIGSAPLKFCGSCGTPREGRDKFCGACGRPFPQAASP
jgi:putative ABC transport system ATP-binding protein